MVETELCHPHRPPLKQIYISKPNNLFNLKTKTTLLPAVLEENHHLPILGIILLQHTLLQHIPVSKEIIQCIEASLAVTDDTISTLIDGADMTATSMSNQCQSFSFIYIIATLFDHNYK